MSSLFSCFGKKSKVKRGNKAPKQRKKEKIHSDETAIPVEDERKPPLEESVPDKSLSNGDIHIKEKEETKTEENSVHVEEPSSPLIKELENKLQERREKNNPDEDHEVTSKHQLQKLVIKKPPPVSPKPKVVAEEINVAEPLTASDHKDDQIEKLRSEIAQLRTENIKLRDKNVENAELHHILSEKSQLEEKIKTLQDTLGKLQESEAKVRLEYEEYKTCCANEKDKVSLELEERLARASQERDDIVKAFEDISVTCTKLVPRLEDLETKREENDIITPKITHIDEIQQAVTADVTELRHHLDELELRIIRLEVDKDSLESLNNSHSEDLKKIKNENSNLQDKLKQLESELDKKSQNLTRVEKEKGHLSNQITVLMKEIENFKRKKDEMSIEFGEKEAELENAIRKRSKLDEELKVQSIKTQTMTTRVKEKEEECIKMEGKLKEVKTLNDELLKRLHENENNKSNGHLNGKMNGDVAQISKSPTMPDLECLHRIAKKFSRELYGGLWRDAFHKLTTDFKRDEKKSLQILMDFCTEAYLHCRRTARQQLDSVYSLLTNPSTAHGRGSINRRSPSSSKQSTPETVPESLRYQIVQFRKDPTREFLDNLYDDFLNLLDFQKSRHLRSFHMKEVKEIAPYITRCLAISWEMVVQDPPMYLQFKVRHGTNIDTDKYDFYSHEGTVVDFLVWPAVLQQEGGELLHKGVVQAVSTRPG